MTEVDPRVYCESLCHRYQTDQLLELRGAIELIVPDRCSRRFHLRADRATWPRIPSAIPHAAMNRGADPALVVHAVLRHGPRDPRDYQARSIPAIVVAAYMDLMLA